MDNPTDSPRTLTRIRSKLRFLWSPRSSTKKASSMREPSFARLPSTATEESKERKTRARKIKRKSSPEEAEEQENIDQSGVKTTPSSSVVPMPENEELQGIDKVEPTPREAREGERTYTSNDGEEMFRPLPIPQNRQGQMESQKEQGQEISDGKSERVTSSPPLLVPKSANKKPGENVKEEPKTMLVREGQERQTKEKAKIIPPMPMAEVRHDQKESIKEEEEKQETSGHESAKTTSSPLPVTKQANEESRLGGIGKVEPTMQETREIQERQTSSDMKLERMPDSLPETKQGQMESREKVQKVSDSDSSKITASHHLLVPNLAEEESDLVGMSKKKTPMMDVTEGQESGKIKEEKILSPSMPEIAERQMERRQKQPEQEISGHKRAKITPDLPVPMMANKEHELVETNKEEPTNMKAMHEEEKYTTKRTVELIPPSMPETEKRQMENNEKDHGAYKTDKEEVKMMENKIQGIDRSNLEKDNLMQEKKVEEEIQAREQLLPTKRISARSDPTGVYKRQANEESRLGGIGKVEPTMQETREVQERQTSSDMKLERMPDSHPETKQGQMESRENVQKVSDSDSSKITTSDHLLVPNLAEEERDLVGMSKKKTPMMDVTEGQESGKIKEEKILSPSMPEIAERQMERRQKQPEQEISDHKRAKITPDLPVPMMANKEHELVETNKEEPTNMEAMHEEEKYTTKRTVELIPPAMLETEKRQMENNEKDHGVYKTDKEEVKMMEDKIQGIDRSNLEKDNLMQEKKVEEEIQAREQLLPTTRIFARSDPTGERNSKDPNTSITREEHSMSKTESERASMFKSYSETNKELKALDKSVKDSHRSNSGMDNIASTSHMPALSKEEIQIGGQRPRGMVITEEHEKIIIERNNMNVENNDKGEASGANISGTYSPSSILAPTMRDGEDEENKPYPTSESIDEDAGHRNKEVKSQGRDKGESTRNGRNAWATIGVIAMIAGITGLGPMVLMKRLEKVRRQKHT